MVPYSLLAIFYLCSVCLSVSAVIGVLGGVILVMSWWRFGSVMACIVVVGLMLGFLMASTVLFTPLGKWRKLSIRSSYIIQTHTHSILHVFLRSLLRGPGCVSAFRLGFLGDILQHHGGHPALLFAMAQRGNSCFTWSLMFGLLLYLLPRRIKIAHKTPLLV